MKGKLVMISGTTTKKEDIGPHKWLPGDPCMSCGSIRTDLDEDGVPYCGHCHANDADE